MCHDAQHPAFVYSCVDWYFCFLCVRKFPAAGESTMALVLGVNALPSVTLSSLSAPENPQMMKNIAASSHAKKLLREGKKVSSLPMGFLLIQLVFTVLLGSKSLHISATLTWTKDSHSRNLVFSPLNEVVHSPDARTQSYKMTSNYVFWIRLSSNKTSIYICLKLYNHMIGLQKQDFGLYRQTSVRTSVLSCISGNSLI